MSALCCAALHTIFRDTFHLSWLLVSLCLWYLLHLSKGGGARYPPSTMGSPQVLVLRVLALGGPYASSGGSASLVATCKHPLRVCKPRLRISSHGRLVSPYITCLTMTPERPWRLDCPTYILYITTTNQGITKAMADFSNSKSRSSSPASGIHQAHNMTKSTSDSSKSSKRKGQCCPPPNAIAAVPHSCRDPPTGINTYRHQQALGASPP